MVFYPAYAIRHFVGTEDIMNHPCGIFEEAKEYAESWLCDDDDCGVFTQIDGEWYAVSHRDKETGMLIMNKGEMYDARKAFLYNEEDGSHAIYKKLY